MNVATIKFGDFLIIPIQQELKDSEVDYLQKKILKEVEDSKAKGIIIEVSGLEIIDSYTSYVLLKTAQMALLLGAKTVISGIRPEVALTLSQMGIEFKNIYFAGNLEKAKKLLEDLVDEKD